MADVSVVGFVNICIVFFISGLTLKTDELKTAFTKRTLPGTLFAFASIVGFTPVLAFAVRDLPLTPSAFATGLAIMCVVPTTLGVGVSLVTSAKVSSQRPCTRFHMSHVISNIWSLTYIDMSCCYRLRYDGRHHTTARFSGDATLLLN